jgi:Coenzyme PQQ synthesis protein D (PqqD)
MPAVRIRDDVLYREIDKEMVVFSLASGEYAVFDLIGSRIWRLIEQLSSLEAIKVALVAEYALDDATCDAELVEFVNLLERKGLVDVTTEERPCPA